MNIKDSSVLYPIRLIKAHETEKNSLVAMLSEESSESQLENSRAELLDGGNDIYLISTGEATDNLGYILVTDYKRLKDSKEIIFYGSTLFERPEAYKNALKKIIEILSDNSGIDHIFLKVQESMEKVAETVESAGFTKEGLFISNQFLQGEFTFYSVYRYVLNGRSSSPVQQKDLKQAEVG